MYVCNERDIEVDNASILDEILKIYIHYVFSAPGQDEKRRINKVSGPVKLNFLKMKDKLHL